jgi:hypothetical protein
MIKQYNADLVENILAATTSKKRLLLAFQISSALCAAAFVAWQAFAELRMFNLFFTVAWVVLEGTAAVWTCRLRGEGVGGHATTSWEAKQAVVQLLGEYSSLRYAKFLGVLCNFLGLVGAIKSMRFYGSVEWSAGLCVGCLALCVLWLREMNQLLGQLQSNRSGI